ncbi:MAG: NUDIX hydrolase [Nocardioidaceae bacterium]
MPEPPKVQRISAYALIGRTARRGPEVLLTRISSVGHRPGAWTLPGGGVDHGESPAAAVRRELAEETGLDVTEPVLHAVHDTHITGRAPNGRIEDFHGIHLIFVTHLADPGQGAGVVETDGTTDAVEWVPVAAVLDGDIEVLPVVLHALQGADPAGWG